MTFERALELILGNLGVLIVLLFILIGGFRGWWVYGHHYDALKAERMEERKEHRETVKDLERRLDRAVGAAERGTATTERATRLVERQVERDPRSLEGPDAR